MISTRNELRQRVARQKQDLPGMYGGIDFDLVPERFTVSPADASMIRPELADQRPRLLADAEQVARIAAYTMLGDSVGDAYASLLPQYGLPRLIELLERACRQGVESVPGAPPELVAFIRDMERVPEWLDMDLVEEGARHERNGAAHLMPYLIRGAFLNTFMNKYAALPMAITGALTEATTATRVKETAAFFTSTLQPGALKRHGAGFEAAAKVRLMHSMVRFGVLGRAGAGRGKWDPSVYGIPIPQSDQMPAGMTMPFLLALAALRKGRTRFTPAERAQVELSRYRCFLLGLPEDLLADTPQGVVDVMSTRQATLRKAWDDETCGALVRATISAYLEPDHSWRSRLHDRFERSVAKNFFVKTFVDSDRVRAAEMGVVVTLGDRLRLPVVMLMIVGRMLTYGAAARVPGVRDWADRRLVKKLDNLLVRYGHANYTSDISTFRAP